MGSCCSSESYGSCAPRNFLSRDEKAEILGEYKESLQKEVKAVEERIKELQKGE